MAEGASGGEKLENKRYRDKIVDSRKRLWGEEGKETVKKKKKGK